MPDTTPTDHRELVTALTATAHQHGWEPVLAETANGKATVRFRPKATPASTATDLHQRLGGQP